MDTIKFDAVATRDDKLLADCGEISVTIEGKRAFVSPQIVGDDTFNALKASIEAVAPDGAPGASSVPIEVPVEFALANGLPMPASQTGSNISAQDAARAADPARGAGAATITGGTIGPGVLTKSDGTTEVVDSASNARTVNNVMRHEYRVLTDLEKAQMKEIKDAGADFVGMLNDIGASSRELSIARTKMEEAVMWAVKHITA